MLQQLSATPSESEKQLCGIKDAHVLLAEDNPVNQKLARSMLNVFGCRVTVVNDGIEVLECFKRENFDLILMDCMMPKMDGYTAAQHIRHLEAASNKPPVPILALTANAMEGDREKCLAAGMSDYLSKPIFMEALRDKISQLLASRGRSAPIETQAAPVAENKVKFDPELLANMRKMGGDKLISEVLRLFYQNIPQLIEQLAAGARSQDASAVRQAAHSMKSSTAVVGALSLSELARDIEHAARDGTLCFETFPLETLEQEYEQVCQLLGDAAKT